MFRFVSVLTVLFLSAGPIAAQGAPSEVRSVVSRMSSLGSFRATIGMGSGGSLASGVLSYQRGKVHLKFSDGRGIAGNGRVMVVYNPATGVAGKQPMATGGGGLGWLLSGFENRVSGSQAAGRATDPNARIQEVKLAWGQGFTLRRLSIKNKDSESWFTITLSNVRPVASFPAALFSYKPPAGARTVENPLDQRN